jgi:hypothetical protein
MTDTTRNASEQIDHKKWPTWLFYVFPKYIIWWINFAYKSDYDTKEQSESVVENK